MALRRQRKRTLMVVNVQAVEEENDLCSSLELAAFGLSISSKQQVHWGEGVVLLNGREQEDVCDINIFEPRAYLCSSSGTHTDGSIRQASAFRDSCVKLALLAK